MRPVASHRLHEGLPPSCPSALFHKENERFPCRHNWHHIPRRSSQENLLRKTLQESECGPVYSDEGRPYEVIIRTTVATRDGS